MKRHCLRWSLVGLLAAAGCGSEEPAPECNASGHACTWLGIAGSVGFNGDGHRPTDTKLYWTMDMLFASDGTTWFLDWNNHLVRRLTPNGTVETVVGWIDPVFPGDGADGGAEKTPEGAIGTDVQLNHPTDLAEMPDGSIMLMAWHNHKLRQIDPSTGRVRIVCGAGAGFAGDGGPAAMALFKQPKALEIDALGNMYILDQQNFRIRRIDTSGNIETIAGNGTQGTEGDGGLATDAMLNFEAGSNPEPSGGMLIDGRKLYIADTLSDRLRVVDLDTGIIDAFAGTGVAGFSGDGGPAIDAQFDKPRDIEIGPEGDLYVADTDNSRVRAIDVSTGIIRTVVGTGELGLDPDEGRLATETALRRPFGLSFDHDGNLYVSDTINSRILRVAR